MASQGTTGFFHASWADTWGRGPVVEPRQPWLDRLLLRPPPAVRLPWYQRLLGLRFVESPQPKVAIARPAVALGGLAGLPVFRALGVPIALGLFFCLLSLVVGADLGGRLHAMLPHRTHVVQHGESLSTIAARYELLDWQRLYAAGDNQRRHPDPDRIPAGSRLDLPIRASFASLPLLTGQGSLPLLMGQGSLASQAPGWAVGACAALQRSTDGRWRAAVLLCRGSAPKGSPGA